MPKLTVTTTNTLEGYSITEYLPPITANVVVGSNLFSDFSASLTDLFGGRSGTYEKKLQQIYQQAVGNLMKTASSMGASCIIGLRVDISEISGKGTQMFMITAYGTPVRANKIIADTPSNNLSDKMIEGSAVVTKMKINSLLEKLKNPPDQFYSVFSNENIRFILETQSLYSKDYILKGLYHYSTQHRTAGNEDEIKAKLESFSNYFGTITPEDAKEVLYTELYKTENEKYANSLMVSAAKFRLIDFPRLMQMVSSRDSNLIKRAVQLLSVEKEYYSQEDIEEMTKIKNLLTVVVQPAGEISKTKKLLGGEKEVWVCQCGNTNDINVTYCEKCGKDIYGYFPNENKPAIVIKLMGDRIDVLRQLTTTV